MNRGGQSAYDLVGFKTTSNDRNALMTDGLPGQVSRFASPPTIGVDHIEVVKGPASVLYGQAQPGGFVNIILKKPQEEREAIVDLKGTAYRGDKLSLSDATGGAAAIDLTGPIDEARQFAYRVVGEVSDRDGWRDFTYEKSHVAPSLSPPRRARGPRRVSIPQGRAGPLPAGSQPRHVVIPARTVRLQEPDDCVKEEGYSTLFSIPSARTSLAVQRAQREEPRLHVLVRHGFDIAGPTPCSGAHGDNHRTASTPRSMAFNTASVEHKALVGVTGGKDDLTPTGSSSERRDGGPLARPGPMLNINIYNPIYGLSPRTNRPARDVPAPHHGFGPIGAYIVTS